jgi:hypothetical protein
MMTKEEGKQAIKLFARLAYAISPEGETKKVLVSLVLQSPDQQAIEDLGFMLDMMVETKLAIKPETEDGLWRLTDQGIALGMQHFLGLTGESELDKLIDEVAARKGIV